MDSALFPSLQLHSSLPSPFSLRSPPHPFGTWRKQRVLAGEGVGWHSPQGGHGATDVRVFCTVSSVFLESRGNLTLPVLIALKTL